MTKPKASNHPLTLAIERRVINAGEDGITVNLLMEEMKIGVTCARNHLSLLEAANRVYRVQHKQPNCSFTYNTFHARKASDIVKQRTGARRDWLQVAFFGPA